MSRQKQSAKNNAVTVIPHDRIEGLIMMLRGEK